MSSATATWQWVTISDEIRLQLTLDSDDPAVIERVEHSARENGIVLKRIKQAVTQDDEDAHPAEGTP